MITNRVLFLKKFLRNLLKVKTPCDRATGHLKAKNQKLTAPHSLHRPHTHILYRSLYLGKNWGRTRSRAIRVFYRYGNKLYNPHLHPYLLCLSQIATCNTQHDKPQVSCTYKTLRLYRPLLPLLPRTLLPSNISAQTNPPF